jgi:hypothetical protein
VTGLEQDVSRLHIPVDEALAVRVLQPFRDLAGYLERLVQRQLPLPVYPASQRLACHVGHDVVEQAIGLTGIVQRQDVGMGESGGDPDFLEETRGAHDRGEIASHDLDGDPPVVLDVGGQVHGGHTAAAQLAVYRVLPREAGSEALQLIPHGTTPQLSGC